MNNKFIIALLGPFQYLDKIINTYKFTLNKLSENFEEIYIINSDNLNFFPPKKKNFSYLKKELNNNIFYFNPKNSTEFNNFIKNKKIILINSIGKSFNEIKINLLLNKNNITQIMISNIGNIQSDTGAKGLKIFKRIILKTLSYYISIFFYGVGIFKKVSVRFVSNYHIYKNFKGQIFSQVKTYLPINSRSYDYNYLNKKKKNKYIIFLDHSLNHPEWIEKRGRIEEKFENQIYQLTKNFLSNLSISYKKKIIVCIHPYTDIKKIKKLLKNFKVVKYQTPEMIRKASLVVFSDSSSIVDAFILKKKIICIRSIITDHGKLNFLKNYHNIGLLEVELSKNFKFNKKLIDKELKKKSNKAQKSFNKIYTNLDNKSIGYKKIINYIQNTLLEK